MLTWENTVNGCGDLGLTDGEINTDTVSLYYLPAHRKVSEGSGHQGATALVSKISLIVCKLMRKLPDFSHDLSSQ